MRSALGVALATVAVVLGVAALVAAATGTDTTVSTPQGGLPSSWLYVVLGALGAWTLVVWIALLVTAVSRGEKSASSDPPWRTIPGMLLAGALLWVLFTVWSPSREPTVIEAPAATAPSTTTTTDVGVREPGGSSADTWLFALGAGLVLVGLALVARSARRQTSPVVREFDGPDEVGQRRLVLLGLLDDALDDLRHHPQPRQAVIAAWARLEHALTLVDVARRPSDTPSRYLARVLTTVDASAAAVERFTRTFERAMFSPHDITEHDQQDAVDALVAVRDELRLLTALPSTA